MKRTLGLITWTLGPMKWTLGPMKWTLGFMKWTLGRRKWTESFEGIERPPHKGRYDGMLNRVSKDRMMVDWGAQLVFRAIYMWCVSSGRNGQLAHATRRLGN